MSIKKEYLIGGLLASLVVGAQTASAADNETNDILIDRIVNGWTLNPVEEAFSRDYFKDFNVSYNNTLATNYYQSKGDPGTRLYSTTGWETYNDFTLSLSRKYDDLRSMSAMISGVVNASDYRYDDRGFVPERINVKFENGAYVVPYRAEAGDTFADFSLRTVQTSVKGAQIEFQPQSINQKEFSSVQLFTGTAKSDWSKGDPMQDYYTGASYLVEMPEMGLFSFNWVNHIIDEDNATATKQKIQNVYSVAGETEFVIPFDKHKFFPSFLPDQNVILEGELAYFKGDHSETGVAASDEDKSDFGNFLQMSGTGASPLSWRMRYESYGKDYAPAGAGVAAHQRNLEFHGAWRHENGLQTRVRRLNYITNWENGDPTMSRTWGLNFSGPFFNEWLPEKNITGTADFFQERSETDYKTSVSQTRVMDINLAAPLENDWNGRAGIVIKSLRDIVNTTGNSLTRELSFGGDHPLIYNNWKGTITPTYRLTFIKENDVVSRSHNPTLSLNLIDGQHSAGMVASVTKTYDAGTADDYEEYSFDANYGYNLGAHNFRAETSILKRNTVWAGSNRDLKFGVSWNYNYDKPSGSTSSDKGLGVITPASVAESDTLDVRTLVPGLSLKDTLARLNRLNIKDGAKQPGEQIFETRLLENIQARQRLVIQHSNGSVTRTGSVIEFDDTTNVASTERAFKQVRSALFSRYGQPSNIVEKGDFSTSIASELRSGEFVRIYEWNAPGGIIRFGIPSRLDSSVRMEIQHAGSLPPTANSNWSMETVR